jgi:hypothetical protein
MTDAEKIIPDALDWPELDDLDFTAEELDQFQNSRVYLALQKALREKLKGSNVLLRHMNTEPHVRSWSAGRVDGIESALGLISILRQNNIRQNPEADTPEEQEELSATLAATEQRAEQELRALLEDT